MNTERLVKLRDYLRDPNLTINFDMKELFTNRERYQTVESFRSALSDSNSGVACCAMGLLPFVFPEWQYTIQGTWIGMDNMDEPGQTTSRFFELEYRVWCDLFCRDSDTIGRHDPRAIAAKITALLEGT